MVGKMYKLELKLQCWHWQKIVTEIIFVLILDSLNKKIDCEKL